MIARTEVDGLCARHANAEKPHVAIEIKEPPMMQHEQCDERGEPAWLGLAEGTTAIAAIGDAARHAPGPR